MRNYYSLKFYCNKMDECEEISEYDIGIEIIDQNVINELINTTNEDEIDIFNMTSLNTLVFLSNRENNNNESYCEEEKRLTLAYENLQIFPFSLFNQLTMTIQILDISHNKFQELDFLKQFKNITTLICDHNNISSNTILPNLPSLKILWLNFCKINELYPWAGYLKESCPKLKYLSLMGNLAAPSYLNGGTFYEYLQYRLFIISLFPMLEHLDDRSVTEDQRREAQRLYKRPIFERLTLKTHKLPTYLQNVSNKFTNVFQYNPFAVRNKNIIV